MRITFSPRIKKRELPFLELPLNIDSIASPFITFDYHYMASSDDTGPNRFNQMICQTTSELAIVADLTRGMEKKKKKRDSHYFAVKFE